MNERMMKGQEQARAVEGTNGLDSGSDSIRRNGQRLKDGSKKVAQTKEMLSKQPYKIARGAEEHERIINKARCSGFDCRQNKFRELSKKAQKVNNVWWQLSGLLGDQRQLLMNILLQTMFTVATTAFTIPIFLSYRLHVVLQILKVSATIWNGGSFLLDGMPRQVILKEKKKEMQTLEHQQVQSTTAESSAKIV